LEAGSTCSPGEGLHFFGEAEKPEISAKLAFWEGTGSPEGRAGEAEERRDASAQENLTACCARESADRKGIDSNCQHWLCEDRR